jgi:hypothetical protein
MIAWSKLLTSGMVVKLSTINVATKIVHQGVHYWKLEFTLCIEFP